MTVTDYTGWVADGQRWTASSPVTALAHAAAAHGVSFGIIGDHSHAVANPPEDHMPYSHTPWPGAQPYPYVLAIDLMTTNVAVANRIIAAKETGILPCLKYMNYTNAAGEVEHISWEPSENEHASSDAGHIHLSFRTDHVMCTHANGFDPFVDGSTGPTAPTMTGDDMLTHWPTIQQGSTGARVRVWQGILEGHGYVITIDGDFGPDTDNKTRRFQTDKGITVDGQVGPQTLSMGIYDQDYTRP